MITAAVILGVIVAIGVQWAADRLASSLGAAVASSVEDGIQTLSDAMTESAPSPVQVHHTATVPAEAGTQVAYVFAAENSLEIGYGPVLAFVGDGDTWGPLAILKGEPCVCDCFVDRVLLPGQALTDEECEEMKQRWIESNPVEAGLLTQRVKAGHAQQVTILRERLRSSCAAINS